MGEFYPPFIRNLPQADVPLAGVVGKMLQGEHGLAVFFEIEQGAEIPPHSHGEQWGVVLDGDMELTIGGETRRYRPGDSYFIPAGTVHSARFPTRVRVFDLFADRERYNPRG
jgi:quercetin dioxygenase-like cupin family protein